jgi:hypothetical protein
MLIHDYLIRSEWQLQQELERERLLDPERYWLRLEHANSGLGPLVDSIVRGARSLAAWVGRVPRPTLVLVWRHPAREHP